MSDPAGPLAGVTVLEVGVFMATPYATMQLADLGARVLKVENPAAPTRSRGSDTVGAAQSPGGLRRAQHHRPGGQRDRGNSSDQHAIVETALADLCDHQPVSGPS